MSSQHFLLVSPEFEVTLQTIAESDGENLRQWKNANRFSFFFQDIITPEQQAKWFQGYLGRENDYMFIVRRGGLLVGCMGFRLLDQHADIYNVIRANKELDSRGLMGSAMRLMCSFIAADFSRDIGARVLRSNPAVEWYRKLGFHEIARHDTFVEIELDMIRFRPCSFHKVV